MFCSCFKPVEEVAEIKKEEQPNLYDNKQDIEAFNQQENFEGQNFKEGFKKSYPEDSHKDVEDQYEDPNQDNHDQQQPEEYEQNQEDNKIFHSQRKKEQQDQKMNLVNIFLKILIN